jgi:hypothetical protein
LDGAGSAQRPATPFIGHIAPTFEAPECPIPHRLTLRLESKLQTVTTLPRVSFLGKEDMSPDGEAFRQLCEKAGAVLTHIVTEIEDRYGIKIAELRVD